MFYLCGSCFRNQIYCSPNCKNQSQKKSKKIRNHKYASSENGKVRTKAARICYYNGLEKKFGSHSERVLRKLQKESQSSLLAPIPAPDLICTIDTSSIERLEEVKEFSNYFGLAQFQITRRVPEKRCLDPSIVGSRCCQCKKTIDFIIQRGVHR